MFALRGSSRPTTFIDFEASGLNAQSWPVEVGWAVFGGDCGVHLIRPEEGWLMSAWDPSAEALHGISVDQLHAEGEACRVIAARMNAALAGHVVYSDAPDWDAFWLYRLFGAARLRPVFELHDFATLMIETAPEHIAEIFAMADVTAPRCHRARADALHLREAYSIALRLAARKTGSAS